jgi:hypothetical protein
LGPLNTTTPDQEGDLFAAAFFRLHGGGGVSDNNGNHPYR